MNFRETSCRESRQATTTAAAALQETQCTEAGASVPFPFATPDVEVSARVGWASRPCAGLCKASRRALALVLWGKALGKTKPSQPPQPKRKESVESNSSGCFPPFPFGSSPRGATLRSVHSCHKRRLQSSKTSLPTRKRELIYLLPLQRSYGIEFDVVCSTSFCMFRL